MGTPRFTSDFKEEAASSMPMLTPDMPRVAAIRNLDCPSWRYQAAPAPDKANSSARNVKLKRAP